MAAHNPAGYVRATVRRDGFPWSLANAFQKPVRASATESLEERSIAALEDYLKKLKKGYGEDGFLCDARFNLLGENGGSLPELLECVKTAIGEVLK
jgi:CRISPR system Cascade subunit CasC